MNFSLLMLTNNQKYALIYAKIYTFLNAFIVQPKMLILF